MKRLISLFLISALMVSLIGGCTPKKQTVKVAVEFNNHAAAAWVAHDMGWFEEGGLEMLPVFQAYESGAAIAAALSRGDIQIAYLGLTGAITAYARGVPMKIIAGVHQYGYGLVARPEIKEVADLEGKTIGSLRQGTVTDMLVALLVDRYDLDDLAVLRMSPSDLVIALISGSLDAAFIPEQHATVAEANGFPMLVKSQDLWPDMQGDVLVVTMELIEDNPELVRELMEITQRATDWVNDYPDGTAMIMARQLAMFGNELSPASTPAGANLEITPEIISRSMERVVYSTSISPRVVQENIDFLAAFGYIEEGIEASDILDLSFLEGG